MSIIAGENKLAFYYLLKRGVTVETYLEKQDGTFELSTSKLETQYGYVGDTKITSADTIEGYVFDSDNALNKLSTTIVAGENKLAKYYNLVRTVSVEIYLEKDDGTFESSSSKLTTKTGIVGDTVSTTTDDVIDGYLYDSDNTLNKLSLSIVAGENKLAKYFNKVRTVTIEIYLEASDGTFNIDANKTTTQTGIVGETIETTAATLEGYVYDSDNTSNKLSLTIVAGENKLAKYYNLVRTVTIEIYLEATDGTFNVDSNKTTTQTGIVGETVETTAATLEGYVYDSDNTSNKLSLTIVAGENKLAKYYNLVRSVTVRMFFQLKGGEFEEDIAKNETLTGIVGETASVGTYTFDGYSLDEENESNVTSKTIEAVESQALALYYKKIFAISITNPDNTTKYGSISVANSTCVSGEEVEITVSPVAGYSYVLYAANEKRALEISNNKFTAQAYDTYLSVLFYKYSAYGLNNWIFKVGEEGTLPVVTNRDTSVSCWRTPVIDGITITDGKITPTTAGTYTLTYWFSNSKDYTKASLKFNVDLTIKVYTASEYSEIIATMDSLQFYHAYAYDKTKSRDSNMLGKYLQYNVIGEADKYNNSMEFLGYQELDVDGDGKVEGVLAANSKTETEMSGFQHTDVGFTIKSFDSLPVDIDEYRYLQFDIFFPSANYANSTKVAFQCLDDKSYINLYTNGKWQTVKIDLWSIMNNTYASSTNNSGSLLSKAYSSSSYYLPDYGPGTGSLRFKIAAGNNGNTFYMRNFKFVKGTTTFAQSDFAANYDAIMAKYPTL